MAAPALVQQAGNAATTTSLVVTLGAAPGKGNALFAFVTDTLGVNSISGGGVTWINIVSAGGRYGSAIWGGFGSTGVGTAITLATGSTPICAQVVEFSGVDVSDISTTIGQTTASPGVGPLTPNYAETLALANIGWNTTATISAAGGGFTNLTQQLTGTTKVQGAYKILSAIAAGQA